MEIFRLLNKKRSQRDDREGNSWAKKELVEAMTMMSGACSMNNKRCRTVIRICTKHPSVESVKARSHVHLI